MGTMAKKNHKRKRPMLSRKSQRESSKNDAFNTQKKEGRKEGKYVRVSASHEAEANSNLNVFVSQDQVGAMLAADVAQHAVPDVPVDDAVVQKNLGPLPLLFFFERGGQTKRIQSTALRTKLYRNQNKPYAAST